MKRVLLAAIIATVSTNAADRSWVKVAPPSFVIALSDDGGPKVATEPIPIPQSPRSTTPPLIRNAHKPPKAGKKRRNRFSYASGDLSSAIASFKIAKQKIETIHEEAVRAEAGRDTVGKDVLYSA